MSRKFNSRAKLIVSIFALCASSVFANVSTTFANPNKADPNLKQDSNEKANAAKPSTAEGATSGIYKEFHGFRFALSDASEINFDDDMNPTPNPRFWNKSTSDDSGFKRTVRSKGLGMAFEQDSHDGKREFITTNTEEARARLTVYKGKTPVSHTIISKYGAYSATQGLCEILKTQTKSDNFEDMAAKAETCSVFLDRKVTDKNLPGLVAVHKANLELMRNSIAGSMVPAAEEPDFWDRFAPDRLKSVFPKKLSNSQRSVITKSSSAEEIADRYAIADLAKACGRLFKPKSTSSSSAAPVTPPAASAPAASASKPVVK